MRIGTEMPPLDGATEWFGGTQASAEAEVAGRPTLIHFWSMSCGICKDNMPRIAEWRDQLKAQGLRVIAVHMPRYEADTDVEWVLMRSLRATKHVLRDARQSTLITPPALLKTGPP